MTWTGYLPPVADYPSTVPATVKDYPDTLISTTDVQPLLTLLSELPHGTPIACDCETTGLFPYEDDVIRGVSIAFRTDRTMEKIHSFYIPVGYPNAADNLGIISQKMIFRAIKNLEPYYIFWHGKFDFAFLRQLPMDQDGSIFFPFPKPLEWWDGKIVAWLLDENMPTGLKEQAAFHFGEDSKDEQKLIKKLVREKGWDGLTPADTYLYAAKDAELTLRLYERQQELIDHPSTLGDIRPAIGRELAIQGVLSRMEATGILINPELLESMTEEAVASIALIESVYDFNMNSPMQLKKYLIELGFDVTSTARDKLEALSPQTSRAEQALTDILKHRRLKKALTGYLVPLKARMGRDGRIHAGFSSTGTVTGRFSCSNPNLQTIPRGDTLVGVRDLFIPEPGFELWEYDLSAAEMRVMGGMAGQQNMIEALESGADVHGMLAAQVFGEKYTPLQRRYAKNIGYGWNYGLTSVKTAAKYIKGADGEKIAQKILTGLKKLYPDVVGLMNRTTRQAEKEGYAPIHETAWPGRFRRFRTPSVRRPSAYTALNAQIQGGIGELMKSVMLEAEEPLNLLGARLCLQVHDSLVIEVAEGGGPLVGAVLQNILDKVSPFAMSMIFDWHEWSEHE